MCNILLVTCSSDATPNTLRCAAGDAIATIGQIDASLSVRERHLYPQVSANVSATRNDLLLQEIRAADVDLIEAPVTEGHLPAELVYWSANLERAALWAARERSVPAPRPKLAIVVAAAARGDETSPEDIDLPALAAELRARLKPAGISELALLEPDPRGYPLRRGALMLIIAQAPALLH